MTGGVLCSVLPIAVLGAASAICYLRTRRAVLGVALSLRTFRGRP